MKLKNYMIGYICLLLLLSSVPVQANSNIEQIFDKTPVIQPRFTNIRFFDNTFDIADNGKASVTSLLAANGSNQITISAYLQKYQNGRWTTVKHWTTTQKGSQAALGVSWYITSGYQYRLVSYGYVYSAGKLLESTSYTSSTRWY